MGALAATLLPFTAASGHEREQVRFDRAAPSQPIEPKPASFNSFTVLFG